MLISRVASVIYSKPGKYIARPSRPIDYQRAERGVGEKQPDHIALGWCYSGETKERACREIPPQHIPARTYDKRRQMLHLVEQLIEQRADALRLRFRIECRLAQSKLKELYALDSVESQDSHKIIQHFSRYADWAGLLEPGVPGHAHPG